MKSQSAKQCKTNNERYRQSNDQLTISSVHAMGNYEERQKWQANINVGLVCFSFFSSFISDRSFCAKTRDIHPNVIERCLTKLQEGLYVDSHFVRHCLYRICHLTSVACKNLYDSFANSGPGNEPAEPAIIHMRPLFRN